MARRLKSDRLLFLATLLLVSASIVMVYSASAVQALAKYQTSAMFLFKQGAWVVLGITLMSMVMRVDYHQYRRPALIWSFIGFTVLLLLVVLTFSPRNGTSRWITINGLSLQPSEIAKLVAIVFTAAVLEWRMHRVNEVGYALMPIGLVALTFAGLILLEPDFGTAAVLIGIVTVMVFAAGLT